MCCNPYGHRAGCDLMTEQQQEKVGFYRGEGYSPTPFVVLSSLLSTGDAEAPRYDIPG